MVDKKRALRACLLVALLFLVLAGWGQVQTVSGPAARAPALSGRAFALGALEASPEESFDGLASARMREKLSSREAPAWFEEEVFSLEDEEEVMADESWSVVGFTREGSAAEVATEVACQLRQHGWTMVESGVAGSATGVKEGGRCQWLWLSCTAVGEEVSVVVQVSGAP